MDFATVVPPYVAKPLRLRPFRAVMLAPRYVGDPSSSRALARPYRADAGRLAEWIATGRAAQDEASALYLHEYTDGGLTVRGLVGTLDVAERAHGAGDRAVWPHEAIHPEQATELAARMVRLDLNPAPILLVHDGSSALRSLLDAMAADAPTWKYVDRAGQGHRIWAVRDPGVLRAVEAELASTRSLLADGHHRYAAYLALQQEHPGTAWDAGLAMLIDQRDTPLFLGAIHRTLLGSTIDQIETAAKANDAVVEHLDKSRALASMASNTAVVTDGTVWASVRAPHSPDQALVEWLHDRLLPTMPAPPRIAHHHSVDAALTAASTDSPAVLLPSPTFHEVRSIVEAGRLLPEKATSFQPKPSLGALMRPVRGG